MQKATAIPGPLCRASEQLIPFSYMSDDDNPKYPMRHPLCSRVYTCPLESRIVLAFLYHTSQQFTYERSFQWLPSTNKLMAQKVALICANAVKPIASCSQRTHVSECLGAMLGCHRSRLSSARLITDQLYEARDLVQ